MNVLTGRACAESTPDTHMAEMYDLWCLLGNVMRSMVREGAIEGVNVDEFMRLHRAERDALDRLDVIDLALGASQHRENRRPFSYRLNADNTARILRMRRLRDKRARVGVLCSASAGASHSARRPPRGSSPPARWNLSRARSASVESSNRLQL